MEWTGTRSKKKSPQYRDMYGKTIQARVSPKNLRLWDCSKECPGVPSSFPTGPSETQKSVSKAGKLSDMTNKTNTGRGAGKKKGSSNGKHKKSNKKSRASRKKNGK